MSGGKDNTRSEDFKRATSGAVRALAQNNEVQVAFQPGPPGLAGKRVRLPLPTRALPAAEMAHLRGVADSQALRLRHHDDAVHAARMPARREARDAYDAATNRLTIAAVRCGERVFTNVVVVVDRILAAGTAAGRT